MLAFGNDSRFLGFFFKHVYLENNLSLFVTLNYTYLYA